MEFPPELEAVEGWGKMEILEGLVRAMLLPKVCIYFRFESPRCR